MDPDDERCKLGPIKPLNISRTLCHPYLATLVGITLCTNALNNAALKWGHYECDFLMESHISAYLYLPLTWNINLVSLGVLVVPHKNPFLSQGFHLFPLLLRYMNIYRTSKYSYMPYFRFDL
jgi:hypothetical protein